MPAKQSSLRKGALVGPLIGAAMVVVSWPGLRQPDAIELARPAVLPGRQAVAQAGASVQVVAEGQVVAESVVSAQVAAGIRQRTAVADRSARITADPGPAAREAASIRDLSRADVGRRLDAVIELANRPGIEAQLALAAAAQHDADARVREEAVSALGQVDGQIRRQALASALQDADVAVRRAAIEALADIGGGEAAVRILAPALHDADVSLREEAVNALGNLGGNGAIDLLRQAAQDDAGAVREAAREYLAELGGGR